MGVMVDLVSMASKSLMITVTFAFWKIGSSVAIGSRPMLAAVFLAVDRTRVAFGLRNWFACQFMRIPSGDRKRFGPWVIGHKLPLRASALCYPID